MENMFIGLIDVRKESQEMTIQCYLRHGFGTFHLLLFIAVPYLAVMGAFHSTKTSGTFDTATNGGIFGRMKSAL